MPTKIFKYSCGHTVDEAKSTKYVSHRNVEWHCFRIAVFIAPVNDFYLITNMKMTSPRDGISKRHRGILDQTLYTKQRENCTKHENSIAFTCWNASSHHFLFNLKIEFDGIIALPFFTFIFIFVFFLSNRKSSNVLLIQTQFVHFFSATFVELLLCFSKNHGLLASICHILSTMVDTFCRAINFFHFRVQGEHSKCPGMKKKMEKIIKCFQTQYIKHRNEHTDISASSFAMFGTKNYSGKRPYVHHKSNPLRNFHEIAS